MLCLLLLLFIRTYPARTGDAGSASRPRGAERVKAASAKLKRRRGLVGSLQAAYEPWIGRGEAHGGGAEAKQGLLLLLDVDAMPYSPSLYPASYQPPGRAYPGGTTSYELAYEGASNSGAFSLCF